MSDLLFGRFHDRLKGFSRENLGEGMVFIAGPTCAGKNAIIDGIIAASDGCARRCISATTRKPRDYEVHGEHYLFMSESEFKDAIASGQLLEYVRQGEDFYGKLLAPIEENQAAGIISLIEMEVEGIKNVKDRFPNALRIFIFLQ